MKKIFYLSSFLLFCLGACNNNKEEAPKSENDVDAARNFIRSALDGKFSQAKTYLLLDSANIEYLDVAERNFLKAPPDTINAYRNSSITIYNVNPVNDSTTVVIYFNSFKNNHDTLKVLKVNNLWLVDLKYLFEHDSDSIYASHTNKDTLR